MEKAKQYTLKLENRVKELELQNSYLNNITSSFYEMIFIIKKNFAIEYVNNFAAQSLNSSVNEIIGLKTNEVFPPEIAKIHNENLKSIFGNGEKMQKVGKSRLGNRDVWLDTLLLPIKDNQGITKKVVGISRDVTEKVEISNAFKIIEEKFSSIINNIPTAVYRSLNDESWTMIYISDKIEEITGYPASDFINNKVRTFSSIIVPEDNVLITDIISSAIKEKKTFNIEYRITSKNGDRRWLTEQGSGVYDENGELMFLDGSIYDNTDNKLIEESLKESENRYKTLTEITDEGIIIHDRGVVVDVNPSFLRLFQVTEEEVLHKSIFDYVHQEDKNTVIQKLKENYLGSYEIKVIKPNGTIFPVEVNAKNFNVNGQIRRVVSVRDISERKAQQEALIKSEKELRRANATKDKFFSIIAHDLKGPIGNFLNITDYVNENFSDFSEKDLKEILGQLQITSLNTFDLLNNLLTWSKIQLNKVDLTPETFYLYELIKKSVKILEGNIKAKEIKFANNASASVTAYANKESIDFILRNLISNAIKFTPPKGCITVSTRIITIPTQLVEVCVNDTGVGIPSESLDELFCIDKNSSTLGTEGEAGNGLGLILCKEFVEKNGGSIRIESEVSKGSSFFFTVPLGQ